MRTSGESSGTTDSAQPRLALATSNAHKVQEILAIMSRVVPNFQPEYVATLADFQAPSPVENGLSFAENAKLKATSLAASTGVPALADDSGIVVEAMGGAPGIFSARWAGHGANDQQNLNLLLDQIADLGDGDRRAKFVCAAALSLPDGTTVVAQGEVEGTLLREPRGEHGFGYDPAFVPLGSDRTTAELSAEEKNLVSHRSRALTNLAPRIAEVLA